MFECCMHFTCVSVCRGLCVGCTNSQCMCWLCDLGIRTDEPSLFANSWAVDLPHERACPSVDIDFNGPCQSESDMDVRTTETLDSGGTLTKQCCTHC